MKRYIKASVNEEYGNRLLKAYRDDLRFLARCESFDEFLSEGLHTANEQTIVNSWRRKHPDKADDFDEFFDYAQQWIIEDREHTKQGLEEKRQKDINGHNVLTLLKVAFDSVISDINETNNNIYISIDSPYIESREDLISFVDDVKATVGGRFSGTGRGGSWTAWDLISENNISLKVGLVSSMDEKYVKPGTEIFIKIYI